jgi:hypothetical protein
LKKNYVSPHKLPKQQSTSFWSQGILGVNTPAKSGQGRNKQDNLEASVESLPPNT